MKLNPPTEDEIISSFEGKSYANSNTAERAIKKHNIPGLSAIQGEDGKWYIKKLSPAELAKLISLIPVELRPAIETIKAQVASGENQKWSAKDFNALLDKLEKGYPLTEKQAQAFEELKKDARQMPAPQDYTKEGFEYSGKEINAGDLVDGEEIVTQLPGDTMPEKYKVTNFDLKGITLKGPQEVTLPLNERIMVNMVKATTGWTWGGGHGVVDMGSNLYS